MKVLNHSNTEKVQSEKHSGCPGSRMRELNNNENNEEIVTSYGKQQSRLGQYYVRLSWFLLMPHILTAQNF